MTLDEFLTDKTVEAIETFFDGRLINVVMPEGALYGVEVSNPPENTPVVRRAPVTQDATTLSVDGLTFVLADYTMLLSSDA
jgi:hypothetical protein